MDITAASLLSAQAYATTKVHISGNAPQPSLSPANDANSLTSVQDGTRALGVFEADLQTRLKMKLSFTSTAGTSAHSHSDRAKSDEVAENALSAAKQLVDESPESASQTIVRFKAEVHHSAEFARHQVDDSMDPLDSAVDRIDTGLDALTAQSSNNRTSSTSVLEIDTQVEQESKIRIRTEEGDIVKLSFKYHDQTSLDMTVQDDGARQTSATEFEFGSSFALKMKVDGDLNESELASVMSIVAHAEKISASFYAGDMNATLGDIGGMAASYDQIASYGMRFQFEQQSEISYREVVGVERSGGSVENRPPQAVSSAPPADESPAHELPANELPANEPLAPVESRMPEPPASSDILPVDAAQADGSEVNRPSIDFFQAITRFLRLVGDGFSSPDGDNFATLHHSRSVKLTLLQAVIHATSPVDSQLDSRQFLEQINASTGTHDGREQ